MAVKDVRGDWTIQQSTGHVVQIHIDNQDDDGTFASPQNTADYPGEHGTIDDAKATDQEISFRVNWSGGARGRYVGRFDFQGRLTGNGFDEANPTVQCTWACTSKTFGNR
ncbi:hypothetical protein [Streptomyces netropsis]|uniref:Uncharacterized protein n=1 Tax=Streptomyces netropsis TaxID=55404 RepID=A0A7W7PI79_STRNE|nr:hypothetical protein [Streptomyces netropsis]MBB4890762.1 hypothetical protein [Streptomyces netropsis]